MPEKMHANDQKYEIAAAVDFFRQPILNSPYEEPCRYWEMDEYGQPTQKILPFRRPANFAPHVSRSAKIRPDHDQDCQKNKAPFAYDPAHHACLINEIRQHLHHWRKLPRNSWQVTPVTSRLLEHWRTRRHEGTHPFFCQLEAIETIIWLSEVAPKNRELKNRYLEYLEAVNQGLPRLALKMATGSGKTMVIAMLIAWETLNATRGQGNNFSNAFLVVTPGLTIRDRLRTLQPNDPDSIYKSCALLPPDMLGDLYKSRIAIKNFHAFRLRNKMEISSAARTALEGWRKHRIRIRETENEMLARLLPEFTATDNIVVINDEAHHCYREDSTEGNGLRGKKKPAIGESSEHREDAGIWISGLEAIQRRNGINRIFDFSATPFFPEGSGKSAGGLFPWTMSEFSLLDAIECGIVKFPRIPASENIGEDKYAMFHKLWDHIRKDMPKKNMRKKGATLPTLLLDALDSLYDNYRKVFALWQKGGMSVPPCFVVICNNTASSRLLYEYVAGSRAVNKDGNEEFRKGKLPLFSNFDDSGAPLPKPRTLLVDSAQLESGEKLTDEFLNAAKSEIEHFKTAILQRGGKEAMELRAGNDLSDAAILREAMNTVGKNGRLGAGIRCVISVGMLNEGWDAKNVTHILGARAFSSQFLCEQVIGRALRRQSYGLNSAGLPAVEYADILGIPFDFAAQPVFSAPAAPVANTHIHAVCPERKNLEIRFPRVMGYRTEFSCECLEANFTDESCMPLTRLHAGTTETDISSPARENGAYSTRQPEDMRGNTALMHLTRRLLEKFRDRNNEIKYYLFGQLRQIAQKWTQNQLIHEPGFQPSLLLRPAIADVACEKIFAGILSHSRSKNGIQILLDPHATEGSSSHVNFSASTQALWKTDGRKCQINYAIIDSMREEEFCGIAERHDEPFNHIAAYVKNSNLGFEVPYLMDGLLKSYFPDFILQVSIHQKKHVKLAVDLQNSNDDFLRKKLIMEKFWIPGVNNEGSFGRWAFLPISPNASIRNALADALAKLLADDARVECV